MLRAHYKNVSFRVLISLIMSWYLLVHGKDLDFIARVSFQPRFYLGLLLNFPVTLGIVYMIHRANLKLDEKLDWRPTNIAKRALLQTLFGVLPAIAADLVFITIYGLIMGTNFDRSEFLRVDFPIIIVMIIALNMFYAIRSLLTDRKAEAEAGKNEVTAQETEAEISDVDEEETIAVRYASISLELDVRKDILYFYLVDKTVRIVTKEREYYYGKRTLNEIEDRFSHFGFCRISQVTIVNMAMVKKSKPAAIRNNLKIIFDDPTIIPDPNDKNLLVKKAYVENFKAALNKKR